VQTPYLFTFIIAYRHRNDRIHNLKRTLDWLYGFGGVEIIIMEQDKKSKLIDYPIRGVKHYFTQSDQPFNKSQAFNAALKYSKTDVIVFGDCDLIMDPNKFISALNLLNEYECVSPYSRVIDLNPNEVGLSLDQMFKLDRAGRGETDIQKICLSGGIIFYRKEAIYKIGGWEEQFIGWGGEDDFQSHKSKQLLTCFEQMGTTCYHLWHERGVPDQKWYDRNLKLLNRLIVLPKDELIRHIDISSRRIGILNR